MKKFADPWKHEELMLEAEWEKSEKIGMRKRWIGFVLFLIALPFVTLGIIGATFAVGNGVLRLMMP